MLECTAGVWVREMGEFDRSEPDFCETRRCEGGGVPSSDRTLGAPLPRYGGY